MFLELVFLHENINTVVAGTGLINKDFINLI